MISLSIRTMDINASTVLKLQHFGIIKKNISNFNVSEGIRKVVEQLLAQQASEGNLSHPLRTRFQPFCYSGMGKMSRALPDANVGEVNGGVLRDISTEEAYYAGGGGFVVQGGKLLTVEIECYGYSLGNCC